MNNEELLHLFSFSPPIILENKHIVLAAFIVAILAPLVNCVQLFPQFYKTYITKSVKDISLWSLILFLTNSILWSIHGYFRADISVIVAGIVGIIVNVGLLLLYFIYKKNVPR
jgi:uncharacterized protein with PQ loop repeat